MTKKINWKNVRELFAINFIAISMFLGCLYLWTNFVDREPANMMCEALGE